MQYWQSGGILSFVTVALFPERIKTSSVYINASAPVYESHVQPSRPRGSGVPVTRAGGTLIYLHLTGETVGLPVLVLTASLGFESFAAVNGGFSGTSAGSLAISAFPFEI